MSITDELRSVAAKTECANGRCEKLYRGDLERIADRIDIAHKHAIGYVDDRDPETMAENGWVRLPKDADGEYISVGDKVTEHEDGLTFKVDGFMDWDGEWWVFMRDGVQAPASRCTHYHASTVQDVLREFAMAVCKDDALTIRKDVVDQYAAKIRLADSGEER